MMMKAFDQNIVLVAAVQTQPQALELDKNVTDAVQLTVEAAGKGAALIVLPELSLSGAGIESVSEAMSVAQRCDGDQTQAFLPIANKFRCHIVFGYIELDDGKLYNSAAIVGPMGIEANFRKRNLCGSDFLWAQASDQVPIHVLTKAGRTAVLIDRDAMNRYRESYAFYRPEQRFYKKGDVDTVCLLTNLSENNAYPDTSWIELAESTCTNVIVSNRVGKDRNVKYLGGSCIIDKNLYVYTHGSSFDMPAVVGGVVKL